MRLRSHGERVSGPLLVITQTTVGKWWLSFETPAQNQSASCTAMAPASMGALLAWLDQRKHPVFVLLPKAQYASLKQAWQLPEIAP